MSDPPRRPPERLDDLRFGIAVAFGLVVILGAAVLYWGLKYGAALNH